MEQEETSARIALIDIGSNTIRTVVYAWRNERWRKRYSERDYTGLIAYIRPDGRLSEEGITRLCAVLEHMQRFCTLCGCASVTPFSTASLRTITNRRRVLEIVKRHTGLAIRPLSAEEEMACDCEALLRSGHRAGVAFDLGGGSCQLFRFDRGGVRTGASLPFGCLSLEAAFVRKGLFPDKHERRTIKRVVSERLESDLPDLVGAAPESVLAMGGTARAVLKVLRERLGPEAFPGNRFPCEALRDWLKASRHNEAAAVALLRRVIPGRMSTLLPGAYAMLAMAKTLNTEHFTVAPVGVREGFLWKYLSPAHAPSTAN